MPANESELGDSFLHFAAACRLMRETGLYRLAAHPSCGMPACRHYRGMPKKLTARIPETLHKALWHLSVDWGASIEAIIRRAIELMLDYHHRYPNRPFKKLYTLEHFKLELRPDIRADLDAKATELQLPVPVTAFRALEFAWDAARKDPKVALALHRYLANGGTSDSDQTQNAPQDL